MSEASYRWQRRYVSLIMAIIAQKLQSASRHDPAIRAELAKLPDNFGFGMDVWPSGKGFIVAKQGHHLQRTQGDVPLHITFKHIQHAFLLFSFQESTAKAFANNRMILQGEIAQAMAVVRILNRIISLTMPQFVAKRLVKRYPAIPLTEKLTLTAKIYSGIVVNLIKGR